MAAQKWKKILPEIFRFSECLLLQNPSNQSSQLSYSARLNGALSQYPKTGGFRKLFLPENDFKTCSSKHFSKKHPNT